MGLAVLFSNPHLLKHSRGLCHDSCFQWHTIRWHDALSGRFPEDFRVFDVR